MKMLFTTLTVCNRQIWISVKNETEVICLLPVNVDTIIMEKSRGYKMLLAFVHKNREHLDPSYLTILRLLRYKMEK